MVSRFMGSRRHRVACLITAAVLVLPAGAWAQSAGDEQYEDPFAPEPGQSDEGGAQDEQPAGDESTGSAPEAEPAAPTAQTPAPPAQEPAAEQLPRTGADAGLLALGGALLLTGGVSLRLTLSEPAPRRR
jgi:hypothetical protein